jgi:hypothetical protein
MTAAAREMPGALLVSIAFTSSRGEEEVWRLVIMEVPRQPGDQLRLDCEAQDGIERNSFEPGRRCVAAAADPVPHAVGQYLRRVLDAAGFVEGQRAVLMEKFTVAGWHDHAVRHRPQVTRTDSCSIAGALTARSCVAVSSCCRKRSNARSCFTKRFRRQLWSELRTGDWARCRPL